MIARVLLRLSSLALFFATFVSAFPPSAMAKEWNEHTVRVDEISAFYASCIVDHYHKVTRKIIIENLLEPVVFEDYRYLTDGKCYQDYLVSLHEGPSNTFPAVAERDVYDGWLIKGFRGTSLPRGPQIPFRALKPRDGVRSKAHLGFYLMPGAFKGGLARALILRDHPNGKTPELGQVASLVHRPFPKLADANALPEAEREGALFETSGEFAAAFNERLGECMARMEPDQTRDFVLSDLGTTEEAAAIKNLLPALGACLPPDEPFNLDKTDLRNGAAISLYRLLESAKP